jgi:hypothetical protein
MLQILLSQQQLIQMEQLLLLIRLLAQHTETQQELALG